MNERETIKYELFRIMKKCHKRFGIFRHYKKIVFRRKNTLCKYPFD